jgi:hypothetical protein
VGATELCPRLPYAESRDDPANAGHAPLTKTAYRAATQIDSGDGHVCFRMSDRDYEREPVADKSPATDLSATEIDELAPRNSLRSVARGVVEVQCIM